MLRFSNIIQMWQILNTSSQSSPTHHDPTQKSSPTRVQSRTWKYGRVVISDELSNESIANNQHEILLTTQPFDNLIQSNPHLRDRVIVVESTEQNKCLETVDQVCQRLMQKGVNKDHTIYIQGGGMLLDLGGFVSSIYMRGIKKLVYLPTTLLAIVDATVGGKNGVNWGGAKNMLGTINHAQEIRISLHFLDTLTDRQFSNGLAEVIKMAITHDEKLFELLEDEAVTLSRLRTDKALLRQVIKSSLNIKIKVVENDQYDKHQRKWLNFGHTIGHAVEMCEAGQALKHGECVAIGMLEELKIGEKMKYVKDKNLVKRVEKILKKFNLPTKIPEDAKTQEIINLMGKDKKNSVVNRVELALVEKIGLRLAATASIEKQKMMEHFCESVRLSMKQNNKVQVKNEIEKANMSWQHKKFPSSKSLSIRYLFLSALSFRRNKEKVRINNFLQCEDTFYMIECLKALGFGIQFNQEKRQLEINGYKQVRAGKLNVGNSGLTARFILPLCAYMPGSWIIECHARMSERPNQQIFNFCKSHFDCEFEWTNQRQNCFPAKITTRGLVKQTLRKPIELKSQESSQFISSVLLNSYLWNSRKIQLRVPAGKLVSQSYVLMTIDCLNNFGASILMSKQSGLDGIYSSIVVSFIPIFVVNQVNIEQDLSSFSYPYALSLIHSAKIFTPSQSVQGDKKFYQYCQSLLSKKLDQNLDFSQCTDTFMTMAAILATNTNNRFEIGHKIIRISGISNQRVKQSNRIKLTKDNLQKIGYHITETDDGLIFPIGDFHYRDFKEGETIVFQTAGDHRLAMSMGILCTYLNLDEKVREKKINFVIDDKNAVNKTFPDFWNYLAEAGVGLHYDTPIQSKPNRQPKPRFHSSETKKLSRTLVLGNRGSGKTAIAHMLCSHMKDTKLIDIDQQITKTIIQSYSPYKSIAEFVENKGWEEFRKLEYRQIQKYAYSDFLQNTPISEKNVVISLGGGVVDHEQSTNALVSNSAKKLRKIYIQKRLQDLQIVLNDKRPFIPNFAQVYTKRSQKYEQICDHIISIPSMGPPNQYTYKKINAYVLSEYERIVDQSQKGRRQLQDGYVYCIPRVHGAKGELIDWANDEQIKQMETQVPGEKSVETGCIDRVAGVQLRVDALMQEILPNQNHCSESQLMKRVRYSIAGFKLMNHSLIKSIPIILTLRTQQQYGLYPDDSAGYLKWHRFLHKVPASYIDWQFKHLTQGEIGKSNTNYIYSYHGQSIKAINGVLQMHQRIQREGRKDLVKICYKGAEHIWDRYHQRWRKQSDILVNLRNPLSRLDNKYKMVIREKDTSNIIRIPTRKELHLISRVSRYFL